MKTEYDYYPLSTTEVKMIVTNYSQQEYTCGNGYSLAYYNDNKQQWETLPTDPVIEDVGWILQPEHPRMNRLSSSILLKFLIVQVNIVFTKHLTEIQK